MRVQENNLPFWPFYCGKDSESKRTLTLFLCKEALILTYPIHVHYDHPPHLDATWQDIKGISPRK